MSSHRSTKYGRESKSQIDKFKEYQASNPVSINVADYQEQEEDEQQTIEFFCDNCRRKLATIEGEDTAHCFNCDSSWSLSKDDLPTIGKRVTEQESLDDSDTGTQETLVSVTDPMDQLMGRDTQSAAEDDTKPKLHGALASLQENSGTMRIYNYVEKSGDGKVLHSFSKGSKSVKGTAK
jgi:hypothetical protein